MLWGVVLFADEEAKVCLISKFSEFAHLQPCFQIEAVVVPFF